jgi:integrase
LKKGVSFYIDQKADERTAAIYLLVTFASKRVRVYTGCRCDRKDWNAEKKRLSGGKNRDKINQTLNDYENLVIELFSGYKQYPTVEALREGIRAHVIVPEKPQSIYERFEEYISSGIRKKSWTQGTTKRMRTIKNHLCTFNPDINFEGITEQALLSFVEYQQAIPLVNSTIQKNIKTLFQFLDWAMKEGYCKNDAYKSFDLKLKGTSGKAANIIALDWDELMRLYQLDIPETKNYLKRVRDVFVFMCFTGLRHSDAYNLRKYNVKDDSIEVVTIKTGDRLTIPLNDYSRAILDRYKDVHFKEDKALPVITNQKMNDYLKELGELAGFTQKETIVKYVGEKAITTVLPKSELMSTHTARRTFVSIGSYLNIPYEIMASWTGHSSETMMARYRKINEDKAKHEMEKINMQ